ncbi:MAG: orotidine-5'-phosphate decarboxylase [Actinomycetales bacterium]
MTGASGASYGRRVREATDARGRFCAGIDPHPGLLAAWGLTDDVGGLETFALLAAEVLGAEAAVVKPQSAFFERHGSRGVAVLERTIATIREAGALCLLDVKRGDIGSTMAAYADAYVDPASPLSADAVTLSPYLGYESLRPIVDLATKHGRGVYVLTLTSNPEGGQVQRATAVDGRAVATEMARCAARDNAGCEPLGSVGLVVGATVGLAVAELGVDLAVVNGSLLAPGVGAQGGTAADLRRVFGAAMDAVLPSSSREILAAGPDRRALRDAVHRAIDEFA